MEFIRIESPGDFDRITSKGVCLVDFNAPWCGPCKAQAPIIHQIAEDFKSRAVIAEVDVSENRELAKQFGIYSIPTLLVMKNGKEQQRFVGMQPRDVLAVAIKRAAQTGDGKT